RPAGPVPSSVAVPKAVVPSRKTTVPVGMPAVLVTMAVRLTVWPTARSRRPLIRWFERRSIIGLIEPPPPEGLGTVQVQGSPSGRRSPDGGQTLRDASGHTSAGEQDLSSGDDGWRPPCLSSLDDQDQRPRNPSRTLWARPGRAAPQPGQ